MGQASLNNNCLDNQHLVNSGLLWRVQVDVDIWLEVFFDNVY